jgi:hypothetical protein
MLYIKNNVVIGQSNYMPSLEKGKDELRVLDSVD